MARRAQLAAAMVVAALVAACVGQEPSPTAAPASPLPPAVVATPRPTPDPCTVAVTTLAAFTQQMATNLAALRPLVVAKAFDAGATVTADRALSATLTTYGGVEAKLQTCQPVADLVARVAALRKTAQTTLDALLATPFSVPQKHRDGAVTLFGLLPEVLSLSEAARTAANDLGVQVTLATVPAGSDKPVGKLPPLPTPPPPPTPAPTPKPPKVATVAASFFGSGVRLSTYRVTGGSPTDIYNSMQKNGPYNKWIRGQASGLTQVTSTYRFVSYNDGYGDCRLVVEAKPAIVLSYTVTLPRWTAPSGVLPSTIQWWNGDLIEIATHEKVHVDLYRAAAKRLNSVLATSTCANVQHNLDVVWSAAELQNCQFDMKEYGSASGLSLKACLAQ